MYNYQDHYQNPNIFIKIQYESLIDQVVCSKVTEHDHHNSLNHSVSQHDCFHKQPFPAKLRAQTPLVEHKEKTSKLFNWGLENDKQPQSKRHGLGIASLGMIIRTAHEMITATSESM